MYGFSPKWPKIGQKFDEISLVAGNEERNRISVGTMDEKKAAFNAAAINKDKAELGVNIRPKGKMKTARQGSVGRRKEEFRQVWRMEYSRIAN